MKVSGHHFRTIWLNPANERVVQLIDQRFLPHRFVIEEVSTVAQMATAIREMHVRGAGLIGASAGYGMYLATIEAAGSGSFDEHVVNAAAQLKATRPTAVNLAWAIEWQLTSIAKGKSAQDKIDLALRTATRTAADDEDHCRMIGHDGLKLIERVARTRDGTPGNLLTHSTWRCPHLHLTGRSATVPKFRSRNAAPKSSSALTVGEMAKCWKSAWRRKTAPRRTMDLM